MLEPDPVWHADEHLERVYRRGRQLRRRRRAVFAAAPVALVVLGVFAVGGEVSHSARPVSVADGGVVHDPGGSGVGGSGESSGTADRGSHSGQHGGAPGGDSRNAAAGAAGAPQNPSPSPGGAVMPAASNQTATGRPSMPTSNNPGGPPAPAQPNTAAPTASTTTACPSSALDYSTITDHSSYTRGEPVTISLVVHNHSNRPCNGPGPCGVGPWASVQTTSGATVWQSHPIAVACSNPPPAPPRLAPGQSATYQAGTWNQVVCASASSCSSQAAPGTYRAVAHRGSVNATGTRFTID